MPVQSGLRTIKWCTRVSAISLAIVFNWCAFECHPLAGEPVDEGKQAHFSIVLPGGFHVAKASPVEDFEIYTVSKDGTPYVKVYVGNQPDFPNRKAPSDGDRAVLETKQLRMVSQWSNNKLVDREVLVDIGRANGWPQYIHAWTVEGPDARIYLADRILVSLKVKGSVDK
jgi:hypothetical protein